MSCGRAVASGRIQGRHRAVASADGDTMARERRMREAPERREVGRASVLHAAHTYRLLWWANVGRMGERARAKQVFAAHPKMYMSCDFERYLCKHPGVEKKP